MIPINESVSGWYIQMLEIIFSLAMQWVSSNIILINVNFATTHETRSNSAKIIKTFLGKESSFIQGSWKITKMY